LLLSTIATQAAPAPDPSSFVFVDYLLWQVRESGADVWAQTLVTSGQQTAAQINDAPFAWNSGIRIGLGHEFNDKAYDLALAYTHYQTGAFDQTSGVVASSFDGAYFANNTNGASLGLTYNNANIHWQFFYNTLDLMLGKSFKIDSLLKLHPFLGLKTASINQKIYTNWLNPTIPTTFTAATEDLKNDFWGIGPILGVDTTWSIYSSPNQAFNLIGNISSGLLYGHWHFNEVYNNNVPTTIAVSVESVNGASPMTAGLLGFQYRRQFSKSDFSLSLGYEAQIWFNQIQFYSLSMGRANRPTSIYGANFNLRYNF
jgi:hypothetical protein